MSYPVHYVPAGDVLPVFFDSYAGATGASVTITGLAVTDIEVYKDGGVTQRASDAGYTLLDTDGIDFDGLTGIHGFSIDTGDNTDAGFYTVGAWFHVVVSAITVDSQTVSFVACAFRLMPAEGVAGKPKVDVDAFGGSAGTFASGIPEVKVASLANNAITAASIAADAITAAKIADGAIDAATFAAGAITATVIADGAIDAATFAAGAIDASAIAANAIGASELAADAVAEIADAVWDEAASGHTTAGTFGEQCGTDIDAILVDTGTTLQGEVDGIQADTEDIQSRLPAALTADGNIKADALRVNGSALAAARMARAGASMVLGTCDAGGTTTSVIASALAPTSAVNDQFNGRIIIFADDTTTTALRGQATDITDYVHATLTFTVTALTTAPSSGDTFTIV